MVWLRLTTDVPCPQWVSTQHRRPANGHQGTCSAIIAVSRLLRFYACQRFIPDAVECRGAVSAATVDSLADHPEPPSARKARVRAAANKP
jgi:hypothetical protein